MTSVQPVVTDDLRVIMCLAFDQRASIEEVAAFKSMLVECKYVVSCCELLGTFDFMLEAALPDLKSYNEKLDCIKGQLARLVTRYESNFVCNRLVRVSESSPERVVWVPCADGVKRVDCSFVDKVTAEGDYMRVHSAGHSWLIHLTMSEMMGKLGDEHFVKLHRSTIVRCGFVERLLHEGRHWTARLSDGTVERIARGHLSDVMAKLRAGSASNERGLANPEPFTETPFLISEKQMPQRP